MRLRCVAHHGRERADDISPRSVWDAHTVLGHYHRHFLDANSFRAPERYAQLGRIHSIWGSNRRGYGDWALDGGIRFTIRNFAVAR